MPKQIESKLTAIQKLCYRCETKIFKRIYSESILFKGQIKDNAKLILRGDGPDAKCLNKKKPSCLLKVAWLFYWRKEVIKGGLWFKPEVQILF